MTLNPDIKVQWDYGTAYDFLSSLHVLHFPDEYGLRGAWAAGVRSRLPNEVREFLETVIGNFNTPLDWIHNLPQPKDAATALVALRRIPGNERLAELRLSPVDSRECLAVLQQTSQRGHWDQETLEELIWIWRQARPGVQIIPGEINEQRAAEILALYANPVHFGEQYLDALETYYKAFFSEEDKRISPKLDLALKKNQKLKAELGDFNYLTKILDPAGLAASDGVEEVVLAPSYWCARRDFQLSADGRQMVMLFSARPKEESLVPGEVVPEDLLLRLKAMTDPTRMRILRYLLQEQLTPAELARRLRLRAPTVTHHLHALKASGMVQFVRKGKNEHLYFAKMDSIRETYALLKEFLEQDVNVVESIDFLDNQFL
ncbi:MAG: winged helix-turn-helix transcriptional regulator [Anaerolineales bacterium]|nr:winged helix-turn-helix transcriptional regulator [Anaerolineales bacterium]